jgi:hypothetical protein
LRKIFSGILELRRKTENFKEDSETMEMINLAPKDPVQLMRGLQPDQREEFLECFQCELEDRYGLPIEAIADMIDLG